MIENRRNLRICSFILWARPLQIWPAGFDRCKFASVGATYLLLPTHGLAEPMLFRSLMLDLCHWNNVCLVVCHRRFVLNQRDANEKSPSLTELSSPPADRRSSCARPGCLGALDPRCAQRWRGDAHRATLLLHCALVVGQRRTATRWL